MNEIKVYCTCGTDKDLNVMLNNETKQIVYTCLGCKSIKSFDFKIAGQ